MADIFSLVGRISLDDKEYKKNLNSDMSLAGKFAKNLTSSVKKIATVSVAAVTAASVAVGKIVKDSIKAYSNYEQLAGGVETLFGAQGKSLDEYAADAGKSVAAVSRQYKLLQVAQQEVFDNANKAYKTAGMSANEYMETVTMMAASLKQSLGGDAVEAARKANLAIIDMSDNANKMGTDLESVKNAYAGFAKGNFTMLDNLKLGYGGTREEMQRLLDDAEKISGYKYDISSYADIVDAIHVVQSEMGITGTTAREAESTIQGSLNMTKAAWENVLVAIGGGNMDLSKSIQELVDSGINALQNILPVALSALDGVGEIVKQIAPVIADKLPQLVEEVLPKLLDAAVSLVMGIISALPALFETVINAVGKLIDSLRDYLYARNPEIGKVFDAIVGFFKNAFNGIINFFKKVFAGDWASVWKDIRSTFDKLWNGVSTFFTDVFNAAVDAIKEIKWEQLGEDIWNWIKAAFSSVSTWATNTFTSIVTAVKAIKWKQLGKDIWDWIKDAFSKISTWATETFDSAVTAIKAIDWKDVGQKIWDWIILAFNNIVSAFTGYFTDAAEGIKSIEWKDVGKKIWDAIISAFSTVVKWFKSLFGEGEGGVAYELKNSIDWAALGESIFNLIISAFDAIWDVFSGIFESAFDAILSIEWASVGTAIWDAIKGAISGVADWFMNTFKAPINAVIDMLNGLIGTAEDVINGVIGGINNALTLKIPAKDFGILGRFNGWQWSPGLKKVSFGKIDKLATGGFLADGQRALVGEKRPEMLTMVNGHALVTPIGGVREEDRLGGGDTYNNTINVYQQPGEDVNALAARIEQIMTFKEKRRKAAYA